MISNSVRGIVPIKLDTVRNLRFGYTAIAALHDKLGDGYLEKLYTRKSVASAGEKTTYHIKSWRVLGTFIWAGLLEDCEERGETLSEIEVSKLIDIQKTSIFELFTAVIKAIAAAFGESPNPNAGGTEEKPKANASSVSAKSKRLRSAN